jgi:hypothetical protein
VAFPGVVIEAVPNHTRMTGLLGQCEGSGQASRSGSLSGDGARMGRPGLGAPPGTLRAVWGTLARANPHPLWARLE